MGHYFRVVLSDGSSRRMWSPQSDPARARAYIIANFLINGSEVVMCHPEEAQPDERASLDAGAEMRREFVRLKRRKIEIDSHMRRIGHLAMLTHRLAPAVMAQRNQLREELQGINQLLDHVTDALAALWSRHPFEMDGEIQEQILLRRQALVRAEAERRRRISDESRALQAESARLQRIFDDQKRAERTRAKKAKAKAKIAKPPDEAPPKSQPAEVVRPRSGVRHWTYSLTDDRALPMAVVSVAETPASDARVLDREATWRAAGMLRWAPWQMRRPRKFARRYEGFERAVHHA